MCECNKMFLMFHKKLNGKTTHLEEGLIKKVSDQTSFQTCC